MTLVFRSRTFRRRFHRGVKHEQNRFENKSRFINFFKTILGQRNVGRWFGDAVNDEQCWGLPRDSKRALESYGKTLFKIIVRYAR